MFLEYFSRWVFSLSKEEKEEALMYTQNIVLYLNRIAFLALAEEENIAYDQSSVIGQASDSPFSSTTSLNSLSGSYYFVNED